MGKLNCTCHHARAVATPATPHVSPGKAQRYSRRRAPQVQECLAESESSDEAAECLLPAARPPEADRSGRKAVALTPEEQRSNLMGAAGSLDECVVGSESAADKAQCEEDYDTLVAGTGAAEMVS